ncbi:hypothetical protein CEP54_014630 [Fusarium duplospermum]|uniref:Uncharacterized protein n=1 Tax=Fusarium duplospermum TaxID=1325734 RepID=A0A428NUT2_9HYPO|nr:hypothetical protein CEP54_014630 [Fusarium duplospermum]
MSLSLNEVGFDRQLLIIDKPPVPKAADLFSSSTDIGDGEGILPLDRRDEVLHSAKVEDAGPRRWKHSFKDSVEFEGPSRRILIQPEIAAAFVLATECHTLGHEETGIIKILLGSGSRRLFKECSLGNDDGDCVTFYEGF